MRRTGDRCQKTGDRSQKVAEAVRRLHPSSLIPHPSDERGVALILTLSILVLVTLLVIAFAISMRVENTASKNFNDLIKSRQLAQGAVNQAVALLRQGTPLQTNAPTPTTFWTAPGLALTNAGGVFGTVLLYS